jgi:hypothetical protein
MIRYLLFFLLPLGLQAQTPLARSHAHNDYEKPRQSLLAAQKQGFTSIEIDVFPYGKDQLRIAHIPLFLGLCPHLEERYFKRLAKLLDRNGGHPFPAHPEQRLILMIDLKRRPDQAYPRLRKLCEKYQDYLTVYYPKQDSLVLRPIEILISGAKPRQELLQDSIWYMRLDGHFGDIQDPNWNPRRVPRISSSYRSHFRWRGRWNRPMPPQELAKLHALVAQAKAGQRELRFWAMPNRPIVWKTLSEAGVDWMNVDCLKKYRRWHHKWATSPKR